jgi:protein-disulfide isomerase/uncharacterized membrane protein
MQERDGIQKSGPSNLLKAFTPTASAHWAVALLLAAAALLSALLISKHFGGGLPGCGPASGCEALEKTAWGKVPGIKWPVSFLGFAYFLALLAGWIVANRKAPAVARWLLRVGGAGSLLFSIVMLVYGKICPYCVGLHAANLAVVLIVEWQMRRAAQRSPVGMGSITWSGLRRIAGAALGVFVIVSLALGIANARFTQRERIRAESDRRESTDRILESQAQTQAQTQAVPPAPAASETTDMWGEAGFTGRYRLGPEVSPIRIVMLTDYQCTDCQRVEREVEEILSSRGDVSLSIKQFPMCLEAAPGVPCNRFAKQTLHSNACWAARAAEAAGILKGDRGFWEMHRWLFARGGKFTDRDLTAALDQMGFDQREFRSTMTGAETLRRVQADCEEGNALGLYFTPMIFVNGVEFKGWQVSGALRRTVEEVAAKNPPPLKAAADRPVLAAAKDIADWRGQLTRVMPPDTRAWSLGAASAGAVPAGTRFVDVVLFGDYQEPFTASMDEAIREHVRTRPNVRYTFRHYPIDPECNPTLPAQVKPEALHPLACRAAKAAEAAGSLAGTQGYWNMHAWLMANQKSFSDESLRAAAAKMGINPDALFSEMEKPAIAAAIVEDARAAQQVKLTSVPMVFVNDRWVWRTMRDGENIALRVIEEAGKP